MVLAPRDISGRSTGSQNPGQFDEHEERKFSDFGYDALLKSTAGWGSSSKQGSDAGRPNPNTAKSESYDGEDYNFADEEEDQSRRNARIRDAARPRSLSRGAARDLRVDRDARSERERARDSREVLRGLEAIHDHEGPIGPPAIGDTPNVPPFPNITFGGPLNQRDMNSNRVTGSPRITERAADVVRTGARDGRLADALGIEDRPSIASPLGHLSPLRPIGQRRGGLAPHQWAWLCRMRRCPILLMFTFTPPPSHVHPTLIPDLAIAGEGDPPRVGHPGLMIVP